MMLDLHVSTNGFIRTKQIQIRIVNSLLQSRVRAFDTRGSQVSEMRDVHEVCGGELPEFGESTLRTACTNHCLRSGNQNNG